MHHEKGLSLLEVMLAIAIASAVALGAVSLLGKSRINAAVSSEQRQLQAIIDQVDGQFAASSNLADLTTQSIVDLRPMGVTVEGDEIRSAFHGPITVEPSSTLMADDSFDVIYHDLTPEQCIHLVPALITKTSDVLIDGASMQLTSGRMRGEDELLDACRDFSGSVIFRFHMRGNSSAAPPSTPSCLCEPQTQQQTIGCPVGQVGQIRQSRQGTCSGGTPACPSLQWQGWITLANTCLTPPIAPPPAVVVLPPNNTCVPFTAMRTQPCMAGMQGTIVQQQDTTCVAGSPVTGPWTTLSNSCTVVDAPVPTCVPHTESQARACPAGYGGQITEERSFTCASSTSTPVPTPWIVVANTCTSSCLTTGSCCVPDTQTRAESQVCPAGSYGSLTVNQQSTSTCVSATATPAPGPWVDTSTTGTCTACPGPTNESQLRWVASGSACPAGHTGSHTWESEEIATRTVSYSCPSGTTTLPAPAMGAWSAWTATGARRNDIDTCAPVPTACTPASRHFRAINIPPLANHFNPAQPAAGNPAVTGPATLTCDASREGRRALQVIVSSGGGMGSVVGGGSILGLTCTSGAWTVHGYGGTPATLTWLTSSPDWQSLLNEAQADQAPLGTSYFYTHYECPSSGCTGPSTDMQWVPRSSACPVGEAGTHTWEAEQSQSRMCTSGTWSAWSAWSDTGATRNLINTCAPAAGMCQSGTMGNDVLSPANWWCPGFNTSTSDWSLGRPTLIGVDDIYIANVTDDPMVGWDNPAGGGVITGWVTMPKASWQGCGMPGGDVAPAVGQYFHASIYPRRTDTPWPVECL